MYMYIVKGLEGQYYCEKMAHHLCSIFSREKKPQRHFFPLIPVPQECYYRKCSIIVPDILEMPNWPRHPIGLLMLTSTARLLT